MKFLFGNLKMDSISGDVSIREAAAKLKERGVGALIVRNGGNPIGIITDRDITVRATAMGRDPNGTMVKDIMTPDVKYFVHNESRRVRDFFPRAAV